MSSRSLLLALCLSASAFAQEVKPGAAPLTADVWPEGKRPGAGAAQPEAEVPRNDGFHRITNVSRPTLTIFPAPRKAGAAAAPGLIVCPGGGYGYTVIDKEGTQIAAWLNSIGYTAAVLKYRTPKNRDGALQDAQRAVRLARENAAAWNVDPARLGIMGFSAGGHLAARVSTSFDTPSYEAIDAIDQRSCRPDFAVLVYPAYLDAKGGGGVAPELNLAAKIPPTLIVHNEDDRAFIAGSKLYDAALTAAQVPHQFLYYQTGGHGYGLHSQGEVSVWPQETRKWLEKVVGK